MLEEEGKTILWRRKGKERQLPDLPDINVVGHCKEMSTAYEYNGCYWQGHTFRPF